MTRKLKISSHVGLARYMADLDEPVGFIPKQPVPSPYSFGPTHAVYQHPKHGLVFIVETSHRVYEVFAVTVPMFANEDELLAKLA